MLYRWRAAGLPSGPGVPKTDIVLCFGVAVNAKKLMFDCWPRLAMDAKISCS